MLAKKNRLTGTREFKRVEENGKIFQAKDFGLAYFEREDDKPSKFGFVVSTKISKDASDRNMIRRHMSEPVRLMTQEIKEGLDVVFLAKTSIMRVPAEQIVREVRAAIRESGILK